MRSGRASWARWSTTAAGFFHDYGLDPALPLTWRLRKAVSGGGSGADIGSHVIDQNGFGLLGRHSGYALTKLDAHALGHLALVPDAEPEVQFLGLFVQEKDAKYLIINDFAH